MSHSILDSFFGQIQLGVRIYSRNSKKSDQKLCPVVEEPESPLRDEREDATPMRFLAKDNNTAQTGRQLIEQ